MTSRGVECQQWSADYPDEPKHLPKENTNHNYCRNPDNDPRGPWCYTTDPDKRFDYCNVDDCYIEPRWNALEVRFGSSHPIYEDLDFDVDAYEDSFSLYDYSYYNANIMKPSETWESIKLTIVLTTLFSGHKPPINANCACSIRFRNRQLRCSCDCETHKCL